MAIENKNENISANKNKKLSRRAVLNMFGIGGIAVAASFVPGCFNKQGAAESLPEENDDAAVKRIVHADQYGAKGDGKNDDSKAIQAALDEALNHDGIVVVIPPGMYRLEQELVIHHHTTLLMQKQSVLVRHHTGNIIRNYRISDKVNGYEGNGKIHIEGGVLDCNGHNVLDICNGIAVAHAEDITFRDLTIKNVPSGHAIELTGVRKVMIDRCTFAGYLDVEGKRHYSEAVQIEPALENSFPGYTKDHTVTKEVTVQASLFTGSAAPNVSPWPCGVGAHGSTAEGFYENIIIVNNRFEGSSYWAIRPFKFKNSVISGNIMTNVSGGIFVTGPAAGSESSKDRQGQVQPLESPENIVITDNIIHHATNVGIYVEGQPDASINHVVVSGNTISEVEGHAIQIKHCYDSVVSDNLLIDSKKNGFIIQDSKNITFNHNIIKNIQFYGFNIGSSEGLDLYGNRITNPGQMGDDHYDGIMFSAESKDVRIVGNVVRTEPGAKLPRIGLNIHDNVTGVVRYGNDFRCKAVRDNIRDASVEPVTTPTDLQ